MTATTATRPVPGTAPIMGTLRISEPAVGNHPTIPTRELRPGDTLYAAGFHGGGDRRYVYDVARTPQGTYVHVRGGWYRWDRIYCHVAAL